MISRLTPSEKVREFLELAGLNHQPPEIEPNSWLARTHGPQIRRELGQLVDNDDLVGAYDLIWRTDDSLASFLHVTSGSTLTAMEAFDDAAEECGRIVDVGCGSGLAANFLAWSRPDAVVVGIDASANGIAYARRTADTLGLSNVAFESSFLQDLEAEREFDLVLSSLVAADVAPFGALWGEFEEEEDFAAMCEVNLSSTAHWYSRLLESLMAADGRLLTLERLPTGFEMAAWLGCLHAEGLSVDLTQSDFVYSRSWDGGAPERMPLFSLRRGEPTVTTADLLQWIESFPMPADILR